jgi:hypothetical protein
MSLDVSLIGKKIRVKCTRSTCGHEHLKFQREILYDANITHNLNKMADAAGIYEALWRPEEIGAKQAKDIIGKLGLGLDLLKKDPEYFQQFNSPNGWGMYEHFVPFVEKYLEACQENPDATIEVSR